MPWDIVWLFRHGNCYVFSQVPEGNGSCRASWMDVVHCLYHNHFSNAGFRHMFLKPCCCSSPSFDVPVVDLSVEFVESGSGCCSTRMRLHCEPQ